MCLGLKLQLFCVTAASARRLSSRMYISSMAGEDGRGRRSPQTVAVVLVLSCLAQSATCFSLRWLTENVKQGEVASEATVMEVRTGSIFFNGKELRSQSASAAATGSDGLLHINLDESDGSVMLEPMFQLENISANEEAWRRLNPTLHCGPDKMKLRAMGAGTSHLKLDMGNASPLPLTQVPETCRFSVKQNALGLVLEVPYNGCNVTQEDGKYLFPMRWLGALVKFTCPMSTSSAVTPASMTLKPTRQPWQLPVPHGLRSLNRRKRQANQPLPIYDPRHPYYRYWWWYNYNMYMMQQTPAPSTTATPSTTASTIKPPQTTPPAYPYPYYPYYYPYYYYPPYTPVMTTAVPATTIDTATGGTPTTVPTTMPTPASTPAPTTMPTPVPTTVPTTTPTPATTVPTTMPTPATTVPTTMPTPAPTPAPTTTSAPKTTKACTTKPSDGQYPGTMKPFVPFDQLQFVPYVVYNKAGNVPYDPKSMPQAGYKSGPEARAQPPPHPGFSYWQSAPWFPQQTGQDFHQFDWQNLQPKQA